YNKEVSPFLMVRYSDNTWSLCHAVAGPMPEATKVPERKFGVCPIIFQEDFIEEKKENTPQTPYAQDTCMIIKSAAKDLIKSVKNRLLSRG
ncbi:MAG: hypothetical protein IJV75_05060, partial [Alphaproteobacteria bacterium]|nr:hypothetical protein [Alphaproteobacteria bacterium]